MVEKEEDAEWDPMLEDYQDTKRNVFLKGPAADLDPIPALQTQEKRTIFIRNLPYGITDRGIINLFLSIGKPLRVSSKDYSNYAVVEFMSFKQAELVIRDLHNVPPYFLKISFARGKSYNAGKTQDSVDDFVQKEAKSLPELPKPVPLPKNAPGRGDWIKKAVHKGTIVLPKILNYGKDPAYYQFIKEDINECFKLKQIGLDVQTKTYSISKGRGYLYMGNGDRFVGNGQASTIRSKDCKFDNKDIHKCFWCYGITIKKCSRCKTPYCSNECQLRDYANHEEACKKIALTKGIVTRQQNEEYVVPMMLETKRQAGSNRTSVLDMLAEKHTGFILLTSACGDEMFGCVVPINKDPASIKYEKLLELGRPTSKDFWAKEGEMVLTVNNNQVCRGIVLSKGADTYRINLIDWGEVVTNNQVYPISDELKEIDDLSGVVKVTREIKQGFFKGTVGREVLLGFKIIKREGEQKWSCVLHKDKPDNVVAEATIEKWTPPIELMVVPLISGCSVIMTHVTKLNVVFVRRCDELWESKFSKLINEVAACSLRGKSLDTLPIIGEMYSARYEADGGFYRAVILSTDKEKAKVAFIDFGNEEEVEVQNLRPLPAELKKVMCFAVKVSLKGVPNAVSDLAVNWLNVLTSRNNELKLTFESTISDGVALLDKISGHVVNDLLNEYVAPIWKEDPSVMKSTGENLFAKETFSLSFPVGTGHSICVLGYDEAELTSKGIFWATDLNSQYLHYVYGDLHDKINEYCNSDFFKDAAYLPRNGELCLAFVEGEWFRAVCIGNNDTDCYVSLLDFGHKAIVPTSFIRKMIREFISEPNSAVKCAIIDFDKTEDNADLQEKVLDYMKKALRTCIHDVEVTRIEEGIHYLSIPGTKAILSRPRKFDLRKLLQAVK